ncbi:MAG: type II toxin-antitoxin system YafQ family toxin, partial [Elusimicrobiota bacterium]|nr:type II toxin-antitoxin system YafQ family toxin [Elusimicrobiota bacterium]
MSLLVDAVDFLVYQKPLPPHYKNHKLKGFYSGCWECHITSDWILIYRINHDTLDLLRTGTHADLF